jgi:hypothetical protein
VEPWEEVAEPLVRGRLSHRVGQAVADQAVSSGTNVVVMVVAARTLSIESFGAFGSLYLVYLLVTSGIRALVGEPALVRLPHPPHWKRDAFAAGTGIAIGASALVAGIGWAVLPDQRSAVLALALLLPFTTLQDVGRYLAFAEHRPTVALWSDLAWFVLAGVGLAALGAGGHWTAASIVIAWGGAGAAAGFLGLWLHQAGLTIPQLDWVRANRTLASRYFGLFATSAAVSQGTGLFLGMVAGLAEVAALRGGQTVFGPLNVLFAGVTAVAIPDVTRRGAESPASRRILVVIALGLGTAAARVTVAALLLPDSIGRAALC